MKKSCIIFFALLFAHEALHAQDWAQTNGPAGNSLATIAFNSKKEMFVLSGVLLRTTNQGKSWTGIPSPVSSTSISNLAIAANSDLYITVDGFSSGFSEIWKSTDNGDTWTKQLGGRNIFKLCTSPDGAVYAVAYQSESYFTLASSDNGKSWDSAYVCDREPINIIGADKGGNVIIGTDYNAYRSTDRGQSWGKIINGLITSQYNSFASNPITGDDYLLGIGNGTYGLFKSTDGGRTWVRPFTIDDVNGRAVLVDHKGRIYFIVGYNAVSYSDDNCRSWRKFGTYKNNGLEDSYASYTISPDSGFYFTTTFGRLMYASHPDTINSAWENISVPMGHVSVLFCNASDELIGSTENQQYFNGYTYNSFGCSVDYGFILII